MFVGFVFVAEQRGIRDFVTARKQCEFFLVRYVPDTVKDEFVNIGVLLREAGTRDGTAVERQTEVRFTQDWSRVRCVDPNADVAMLEALESEIRSRLGSEAVERAGASQPGDGGAFGLPETWEDSFSNGVQITPAKACLAESMPAELEQLMRLYVDRSKAVRLQKRTGRTAILALMRREFNRAGVWDLLRKRIAAASYTRPGDPLRIDCGYRPNGLVRMFHAVSLEGDLESAKVLAFSAPGISAGVRRVENAEFELTAIVEPLAGIDQGAGDGERWVQYRFAVETMEQQMIRVLTTSDLSRVAETARRELNV